MALACSSYWPYVGGVEEHVRNVATHLLARGHAVEVWTVDRGEHLRDRMVDDVRVRYLLTPLPARQPGPLVRFAVAAPSALAAWDRAWRQFRPDLINIQCFGPNGLYGLALHELHHTALVLSSHGETFADDDRIFQRSHLLRWALRRVGSVAAAVTGSSQFVVDDLSTHFGVTGAQIIPNGVDLSEGSRLVPVHPVFDPAYPTILAIGRLEYVKGFDLLLRAFAAGNLPQDSHLVIGGDGSQLGELQTLAAQLGLQGRVHFPGRLARAQVIASMAAATVNVVPSRTEAFGIVVLEAWRSGRPLVATSHGGPGALVADGVNGLVVDPENTAALADALGRVTEDEELAGRLAANGRCAVQRYTWQAVTDQYDRVYHAVLGHQSGQSAATDSQQ